VSFARIALIVGGLLLALLYLLYQENLKELFKTWGWTSVFSYCWQRLPSSLNRETVHGLWWLWLIIGLLGGLVVALALVLWLPSLLTSQPPNPIHDEATKWRLTRNLHYFSSKLPVKCEVVIVRYQMPYSETYADDLKEVLSAIDWKFHEVFAKEELPRGLSLRSFETGKSRACLDALRQRLNDINPAPNPSWSWIERPTVYMTDCSDHCVEVDIGNAPQ